MKRLTSVLVTPTSAWPQFRMGSDYMAIAIIGVDVRVLYVLTKAKDGGCE
ncbi:hypothetical protein SAMN06265784_12336 [Paraburkholderia susongensis]|uniref:Uncharacterized protein n=1 Tax=Paraburkholderia susongensis TaxID=1515439 RepID=A0A1X7M7Y4_9BURK|nr:hypothetical protein SAMN06265784_12336 [Paraburkholderia susongensis]